MAESEGREELQHAGDGSRSSCGEVRQGARRREGGVQVRGDRPPAGRPVERGEDEDEFKRVSMELQEICQRLAATKADKRDLLEVKEQVRSTCECASRWTSYASSWT